MVKKRFMLTLDTKTQKELKLTALLRDCQMGDILSALMGMVRHVKNRDDPKFEKTFNMIFDTCLFNAIHKTSGEAGKDGPTIDERAAQIETAKKDSEQ